MQSNDPGNAHDAHNASGAPVQIRIDKNLFVAIDEWRRTQADLPTRPEAIRRLLAATLPNDPISRQ